MKKNTLLYRFIGVVFISVFLTSVASGAEYKGDQYRSPILRFLHSLFLGGSGKSTQFSRAGHGGTYHYSNLKGGGSQPGNSEISSVGSNNGASSSTYHYDVVGSASGAVSSNSSAALSSTSSETSYKTPTNTTSSYSSAASSASGSISSSTNGVSSLLLSTVSSQSSGSSSVGSSSSTGSSTQIASISVSTPGTTTLPGVGTDAGSAGNGFSGPPSDPKIATPIGDGVAIFFVMSLIYCYFIRKRFDTVS